MNDIVDYLKEGVLKLREGRSCTRVELIYSFAQAADLIEQQQVRIVELEATVDALQEAMYKTGDLLIKLGKIKEFQELDHALCSTPRQNLNAVKREAILDAINHSDGRYIETHSDYLDMVIEYANSKYPSGEGGEQ